MIQLISTAMESLFIIVLLVLLGFVALWILLSKKLESMSKGSNNELIEVIKLLKSSSTEDRQVLLDSLYKNTNALNERLDNATRVIADVQRNVGEMSEIGRGMKELQEFLKSPKLRGGMGEHILNELLGQMLPKQSFHLQYAFASGEKVDAAIKTSAGIIPIDSKFPMENFRKMMGEGSTEDKKIFEKAFVRDVKLHIDSISKKYILTTEGTIDYALMYIPSESVYYEIVNHSSLFDYAGERRVLPVSPTTFYAFLKAILMSFEGQKIEERAREILSAVKGIQKDYGRVEENLGILQKHMTNAGNMMSNVIISFGSLGQKITNTRMIGGNIDITEPKTPVLDK
jgi:DNA recombination protein RmuC